jgi:hypothetical protein
VTPWPKPPESPTEPALDVPADDFPNKAFPFKVSVIRSETYDPETNRRRLGDPYALDFYMRTELPYDAALTARVEAARSKAEAAVRDEFEALGKDMPEAVALVEAKGRSKVAEEAEAHAKGVLADLDAKLSDVDTAEVELEKLLVKRAKTQTTLDALAVRVPALRERVDQLTVDYRTAYGAKRRPFLSGIRRQGRERLNKTLNDLRRAIAKSPEFEAVLAAEEPRFFFDSLDREPIPEPETLVAQ